MSSSLFLQNYALAEPTIRKLYDSKLRLAILEALGDGPKRLSDLRRIVDSNAPNTSTKAKDLEDMGLIKRIEGDYALTPYGRAVRSRAKESFDFYATYEKFKGFWGSRNLTGIPDYLLMRLGDLNDSWVVEDMTTHVTKTHDTFVELLNSIKQKFYGVSPVYHEDYLEAVIMMLEKGVDSKLILNQEIFELITNLKDPKADKLRKLANRGDWFLYNGHLTVGLTVSESFLSLALEGKSNPNQLLDMDFESLSPSAVQWGLDLFDYYMKHSTPVRLSDYL